MLRPELAGAASKNSLDKPRQNIKFGPTMKNSLLLAALLAVFLLGAIGTVLMSVRYFFAVREMQGLQAQVVAVNHNRSLVQSLASDAIEYSKKNDAINPILASVGLKARGTNSPVKAAPAPQK